MGKDENKIELCANELKDVLKKIRGEQKTLRLRKAEFTNLEDEFAYMVASSHIRYILTDAHLNVCKANKATIDSSAFNSEDIAKTDLKGLFESMSFGNTRRGKRIVELENLVRKTIVSYSSSGDVLEHPSMVMISDEQLLYVVHIVPIEIKNCVYVMIAIDEQTFCRNTSERLSSINRQRALLTLTKSIAKKSTEIIQSVRNEVERARERLKSSADLSENLDAIEDATLRWASLENMFVTLSSHIGRDTEAVKDTYCSIKPLELVDNAVSRALVNALYESPTSFPNIIREPHNSKLKHIVGDEGELNLCLDALLDNAVEASNTGHVYVRLCQENITISEANLEPGDYVVVYITDEGQGIADCDVDIVFEPLYTTKIDRRGMGLSVAASIAQRHGGAVKLSSSIGNGTTVALYLPSKE